MFELWCDVCEKDQLVKPDDVVWSSSGDLMWWTCVDCGERREFVSAELV